MPTHGELIAITGLHSAHAVSLLVEQLLDDAFLEAVNKDYKPMHPQEELTIATVVRAGHSKVCLIWSR